MNKSGFPIVLMGILALCASGPVHAVSVVTLPPDMAVTTFTAWIQDVSSSSDGNTAKPLNASAISAKLLQTFASSGNGGSSAGTITRTLSLVVAGNGSFVKSFLTPTVNGTVAPSFTIDLVSPTTFSPSSVYSDITLTNCILVPGQNFDDDKYPTSTITFTYGSIQFSNNYPGGGNSTY